MRQRSPKDVRPGSLFSGSQPDRTGDRLARLAEEREKWANQGADRGPHERGPGRSLPPVMPLAGRRRLVRLQLLAPSGRLDRLAPGIVEIDQPIQLLGDADPGLLGDL